MSARGVTLTPDGDGNQQPVLRHAVVVPAHSFHQVSPWVAVTPPINAMAEKPESLWLTALLLRVPEAFGCYISLRSASTACRLTALGRTILRCQGQSLG